jgi:hypothetical protein
VGISYGDRRLGGEALILFLTFIVELSRFLLEEVGDCMFEVWKGSTEDFIYKGFAGALGMS